MRVKLLPQSDIDEIVRFQNYLDDLRVMPRAELYLKHWKYLGLSSAELEKIMGKTNE